MIKTEWEKRVFYDLKNGLQLLFADFVCGGIKTRKGWFNA